jgi:hypothetical protein
MTCKRCISSLPILFLAALVGCQGSSPPPLPATHAVSGTVVYKNGGPVVGRIKFQPVGGSSYLAEGILGKDGRFTLSTLRPGGEERIDGAPAGEYTVSVIPVMLKPVVSGGRPDIQLPDRVHVHEGENNFSFEISRKP